MDNIQSINFFYPEFLLIATILVVILTDLFSRKGVACRLPLLSTIGILATAWILSGYTKEVNTLFSEAIALDPFGTFFKTLILIATLFIIWAAKFSDELGSSKPGEFHTLVLVMVFGMFLMVSAIDLIMVYLSIELVSISSYILAGYLKKNRLSTESSLKYVLYGAFSSGLMLFGFSILFGMTGSTNIFAIQKVIAGMGAEHSFALIISVILIFAGFGYKISSVPFHFWTPDVYQGAPTSVTAYLSVAPKAAGFALLTRFFHTVFADSGALVSGAWLTHTNLPWPFLMAVLAAVTMTLGNLVAVQQESVKRMLAYSSIAHAGYMLMILPILSGDGIFALMMYMVMYLFMNLGAFFVLIIIQNKTGKESYEDFRGLGWEMPFVGVIMAIFMFSLTGLPPTAGFIGKFYLFAAVIKAGQAFYWLVFVAVINSVVSLYYYLRVVKVMFLEGDTQVSLSMPGKGLTALLILLVIPTVILGIYWAPVASWIRHSLIFFTQTM